MGYYKHPGFLCIGWHLHIFRVNKYTDKMIIRYFFSQSKIINVAIMYF